MKRIACFFVLLAMAACNKGGVPAQRMDVPDGGEVTDDMSVGTTVDAGGLPMTMPDGSIRPPTDMGLPAGSPCDSVCDCAAGLVCGLMMTCEKPPIGQLQLYCCDHGPCPSPGVCQDSDGNFGMCGGGGPRPDLGLGGVDLGGGPQCSSIPCGMFPQLCGQVGCAKCNPITQKCE